MRCQPSKPGSSFAGRLTRATVLAIVLPFAALSACTSVATSSPDGVKALAGTWQSSGVRSCCPPVFLFTTLVIHEDGSYDMTGAVSSKGVIKAEGNYIQCGPFNLWVYEHGKTRVLQGTGLGTQVAFSRRR